MKDNSLTKVNKMNNLMLEYANDIVKVEKQTIINFFDEQKIPYMESYIDFLSKFGGNQSKFFQTYEFDCTFQEIKDIYLENAVYDPVPPNGYCIIANQIVEDWFMIENSTGKIFNSGDLYDENGKSLDAKLAFKTIDDFLWMQLFATYQNEFVIDYSSNRYSDIDNYISTFLKGYELLSLTYLNNITYYLKDKKLYFYQQGEYEIHIHTFKDEFYEQLYL